jgi:hypothetical protein
VTRGDIDKMNGFEGIPEPPEECGRAFIIDRRHRRLPNHVSQPYEPPDGRRS